MGTQSSSDNQGAIRFEDVFNIEDYVTKDLSANNVLKIREAFEALAESQPNGELGVKVSTLK